jgi:hypothetical protein
MGFKIREIDAECKFSSALTVEALSHAIPHATITAVLHAEGACEQRERKLTMVVVVWLVIAMNIYTTLAASTVLRKLARGLRFIWSNPQVVLPKDSAITHRRYQLGARPLVAVFRQVCQPIATIQTQGAFLFGLRLMAIDGTVENVPDTSANAAVFGRHQSHRGGSAFPQVRGVYLVECGTHAVVDAGFWPCHTSERVGGHRLLRTVHRGMLVMWDRGFHEYDMLALARQRGAHVLSRLPAHVTPARVRTLPDGSYLAYLHPSEYHRQKQGERILVRIVEYTLTDPALPGYGEVHRLITTLLNPRHAPAHDLACAYHERWEIELVIDELDTHQRLSAQTLRSLRPVGVIQELYALLLAHYAIRVLMHEAALRAAVDPDRLSFVHALEVVRDAIPEFQMTTPEQLPDLTVRLLDDIAEKRLPERRPRSNARVVKRKMSNFHRKRPEHYHPPRLSGSFRDAVAVCGVPALSAQYITQEAENALVPELPARSEPQGRAYLELRQRELCLI